MNIQQIREKREEILKAAAAHGAANVRIFGSAARNETGPESDIDVLVDMAPEKSLLDLGGFLMDMQDILGHRVEVVTERSLHWYIRDRVLEEAVSL